MTSRDKKKPLCLAGTGNFKNFSNILVQIYKKKKLFGYAGRCTYLYIYFFINCTV